MPRSTPQRCSPARSTVRGGFTLIELLMVIIIIAILLSLLLPAVNSAMKSARKAAVSSEIAQLAQALANFKSKYGDYPPSRFLAVEYGDYSSFLGSTSSLAGGSDPTSPGTGDITLGQLAQRSVSAIRKFWPRVNTTTGQTTNLVYDFNGNGQLDAPYVLHGHECLVFFLGGVPVPDGNGNFGMSGFDKSPTNPFTNSIPPTPTHLNPLYGPNRQSPFFEFNPGRLFLDPASASQIPGYYDSIGNAPPPSSGSPNTLNFYAYFSAYGNAAYDPNDVNFHYVVGGGTAFEVDANLNGPIQLHYAVNYPTLPTTQTSPFSAISFSPNPYTSSLTAGTATGTPTYQSPQSFQIISSGLDGLYGVGGQYVASTTAATVNLPFDPANTSTGTTPADSTIRQREGDNLTNFKTSSLQ
jgi:prepilin-type N-terminal cleavage/methylation domain-containing protein